MKNILSRMSSLLALLVLGGLIALFAFSLKQGTFLQSVASQTQPGGYPGPSRQLDSITPYPGPATGEEKQTSFSNLTPLPQLVEELITPSQLPTSLPDRGVGISIPTEVEIALEGTENLMTGSTTDGLFAPDLDGTLLVAKARSGNDVFLVILDIQNGRIDYSLPIINNDSEAPHIAGKYVAWAESVPNSDSNIKQVLLLDLEKGSTRTIWRGNLHQLDLKDEILIWQEYRGTSWGIYGYDLANEQELTIAQGTGIFAWPRICSRNWVVFMHYPHEPEPRQLDSAELLTHNLQTGETFPVGQIPLSDSPTTGRSHDCDGTRIAWASFSSNTETGPMAQQHVYDLQDRRERILDIPVQGWGTRVVIDGDILLSTVGYDFNRNVSFSLWSNDIPIEQRGQILLSDNRLAWIADSPAGDAGSPHLYTATIIRDK
jgi:hypothetical protein